MKLLELKGENASAAKSALKLVELNAKRIAEAETNQIIDIFETEDPIETIKGLCFIVSLLGSHLSGGGSPAPLFKAIRQSTDTAAKAGHDVEINYKVLTILDATLGHGGSFYLQIHSLEDPCEVILGLTSLFHSLASSVGKDIDEVTDYLSYLIEESM